MGRPSRPDPLPLVDFTAVLGIHTYSLVYRSAYVFTPSLAGLVWISRLLMLEYSLPFRAYTTSELNWPARDEYEDEIARFHEVRGKFLCRGGFHPVTSLVNMLSTTKRLKLFLRLYKGAGIPQDQRPGTTSRAVFSPLWFWHLQQYYQIPSLARLPYPMGGQPTIAL